MRCCSSTPTSSPPRPCTRPWARREHTMHRSLAVLLVTLTSAVAWSRPPDAAGAPGRTATEILRDGECGRCHSVTALGLQDAPRIKSCAGCHAWIHGTRDD